MEFNVEKIKVISISRQSSPLQIKKDEKQPEFGIFKTVWAV